MTSPYIQIMTPCHGGQVSANYAASLLDLVLACQQRDIRLGWDLPDGGTDIARARDECVARFLADPEPTHLLFIDADIGFPPEQVFRLLAFDADFTAATYPIKTLDWARITAAIRQGSTNPAADFYYALGRGDIADIEIRGEFARIRYAGIGFTMIRRAALVRLANAYPLPRVAPCDDGPAPLGLFDCMIEPGSGLYLSEGFAFCRRWRDLGGEIWLDVRSKLTHVGPIAFRGDLFSQLEPVPGDA